MSKRTKKERRELREKFHRRQQSKAVEDAIARAVAAPRPDPMGVPQGVLQASTVAGTNYAAALAAMPANDYGGDTPDRIVETVIDSQPSYLNGPMLIFPPTQATPMIPFRMYGGWFEAKPIHGEVWKFLAAIKRHPKDFTNRLVLADWLEESNIGYGARWAEIIRAMCPGGTATHTWGLPDLTPFAFLSPRDGRSHGMTVGYNPEHDCTEIRIDTNVPEPVTATIRHGFIAEVSTTLEGWSRIGPEVMRWHPLQKVDTTKDRDTQPMTILARAGDILSGWPRTMPEKTCCWSDRLMRSAPYQRGTVLDRAFYLPADLFPKETHLRSTFRDLWFFNTPELAFAFLNRQLRKTAARVANRIGANPEASKP